MEFAPQSRHASKHYGQYAAVALLHVGLVYVLSVGLKTPFVHHQPPAVVQVTSETIPQVQPKDKLIPVEDMKLSLPPPIDIKIDLPKVDDPSLLKPVTSTTIVDLGGGTDARVDGPVAPPVTTGSGTGTATAAASCSNYGKVRDWLGERFPMIADRAGFADRGITHFEMLVRLTVGANGEVLDQVISESSNAYATRAMQSAVSAGLRQLQCKGVGHSQTLSVPLSFTLTD